MMKEEAGGAARYPAFLVGHDNGVPQPYREMVRQQVHAVHARSAAR
jgi:hypothetical protein